MWTIALPLVAAYLAEYLMFLSSKSIVGQLGFVELAAIGIAGDLTFEILIIIVGYLSVAGVIIAQAEGRKNYVTAGKATFQSLLMATVIGIPCTILIWNLDFLLLVTGQDIAVRQLAEPFLKIISTMVLPLLWFAVLRSFVTALASPTIIMIITISAVIFNYGMTFLFVHGSPILKPMGIAGAGLSLSMVNWLMFLALAAHVFYKKRYHSYQVFRQKFSIDWKIWTEIIKLGIPVAGLITLEAGLFVAVSILAGVIGTRELAASQVLMGWVGFPFVIAYGIANATMVRVAHNIGTGEEHKVRLAGFAGLSSGVLLLVLLVCVPISVPDIIVSVFLSDNDPGREHVAALVKKLLIVVAFFQIFDGIQVICSHALRGLRDTLAPLWIASIGYWLLGIGGGSLLAFQLDWGLSGIWVGLALGLTVTGTLLAVRFHLLTKFKAIQELNVDPDNEQQHIV